MKYSNAAGANLEFNEVKEKKIHNSFLCTAFLHAAYAL